MSGMIKATRVPRRALPLAAFGVALAGWLVLPNPASARVWFGFPFPFVVGLPAYSYRAPPATPYPNYAARYCQPGPRYRAWGSAT